MVGQLGETHSKILANKGIQERHFLHHPFMCFTVFLVDSAFRVGELRDLGLIDSMTRPVGC